MFWSSSRGPYLSYLKKALGTQVMGNYTGVRGQWALTVAPDKVASAFSWHWFSCSTPEVDAYSSASVGDRLASPLVGLGQAPSCIN